MEPMSKGPYLLKKKNLNFDNNSTLYGKALSDQINNSESTKFKNVNAI